MEDWQERVVKEKEELDERLKKLLEFIDSEYFQTMLFHDQNLLKHQADYMDSYSFTLKRRIDRFKS